MMIFSTVCVILKALTSTRIHHLSSYLKFTYFTVDHDSGIFNTLSPVRPQQKGGADLTRAYDFEGPTRSTPLVERHREYWYC